MYFSSITQLVDAVVLSNLQKQNVPKASISLLVESKNPLVLRDIHHTRLTASKDDLESYLASYDKIAEKTYISLENVQVGVQYGKNHDIERVEFTSKDVIANVGEKEAKIKNFDIRVTLEKQNGYLPLAPSTRNYLRRMEKQELIKKNNKPSKIDPLSFIPDKNDKKKNEKRKDNVSTIEQEIDPLDTESVSLLKKLVGFVDKEQLFRVLLKKPLKDKASKKTVRLAIIPTDTEEQSIDYEIYKKTFDRNAIQDLHAQYQDREELIKE